MRKNRSILMVLNRNANLASTLGHIISFRKGEPVAVPPTLMREAVNMGAESFDKKVDVTETIAEVKAAQPVEPSERLEDVVKAVNAIADENNGDDFTAGGVPKVKNVSERVGYKVDGSEVRKAWDMRSLGLAEENDA